jgi:hypothetical protein
MVTTVSYEDVQMAVDSIAQLASNVLVGVNAPLLDRGVSTNLDYDRANILPSDYETDIETVWSNPNTFADGDDFSIETIQKNRNTYYQQQSSNEIVRQIDGALSKAVNALSYHMNTGQTNTIDTPGVHMVTKKVVLNQLNSMVIRQTNGAELILPSLTYCDLIKTAASCSVQTPITVNVI